MLGGTFEIYTGIWSHSDPSLRSSSGPLPFDVPAQELEVAISSLHASFEDVLATELQIDKLSGAKEWTIVFPNGSGDVDALQVNANGLSGQEASFLL